MCQSWCQLIQPFGSYSRFVIFWPLNPPPQMPPRSHGVIFISPITISRWISMRVPNLVPIGPQAATCIRPEGYTHTQTHTLLYRCPNSYAKQKTLFYATGPDFVGLSHIYHTNVFEADNIYKKPPQMSFHLCILLFLFRSGAPPMTLLTAGALTDPQLPVISSNVCTTDASLGGVGRVAKFFFPKSSDRVII